MMVMMLMMMITITNTIQMYIRDNYDGDDDDSAQVFSISMQQCTNTVTIPQLQTEVFVSNYNPNTRVGLNQLHTELTAT